MSKRITVKELVNQTRSLLDEENQETVDDLIDILPSLNRANDYALNIIARKDESRFLTYKEIPTEEVSQEISIPNDAFESRIEKVEVKVNGNYYEVDRISFSDLSLYETQIGSNIPNYYVIIGNKIRLVPGPTNCALRLWYLKSERLVLPQGVVTNIDGTAAGYFLVDSLGEEISSSLKDYQCYFNVVDGFTGEVKGTFQVENTSPTRVTIKETPTRSTVLGREVLGRDSLSSVLALDDLICSIHGTCIPLLKQPITNFLIQYTTLELSGKLDGNIETLLPMFTRLENQVEKSWVGREHSTRVKRVSKNWSHRITRRSFRF